MSSEAGESSSLEIFTAQLEKDLSNLTQHWSQFCFKQGLGPERPFPTQLAPWLCDTRGSKQHHPFSSLPFSSALQGYLCCCLKHTLLREPSSTSLNLLKYSNTANNCILSLYYVWKVAQCWIWKIKSLAMHILTTGKLKVELMTDETTVNWEKGNELPAASTVLPTFHYLLKFLSSKI